MEQVGPLPAHYGVKVPLWVAVKLVERGFAKITVPGWMEEEKLIRAHKFEQDHKDFAPDVPFYYYEVFEALSNLPGTLKEEGKVREQISAIHNSRMRKVEEQLKQPEQACFKNIGSIELERIRHVWQEVRYHVFFTTAHNHQELLYT